MRSLLMAAGVLMAAAAARAHFVFVLPDKADPAKALVVFSDGVGPDEKVKKETFDRVAAGSFAVFTADGKSTPMTFTRDGNSLKFDVPAGAKCITGTVVYGVFQRGDSKPQLLTYYPKAAVGGASAEKPVMGHAAPVEVCAETAGGKTRFRVYSGGKPLAGAEVNVTAPGETDFAKATTDADGYTAGYPGTGRFVVYAKQTAGKAGESGGKKYESEMNYGTLVADVK